MVTTADIQKAGILVVDDKEANVRLLEGMLRVAGYTAVESTMDPAQVCALHMKNRYGLILLDLQMPGMDGFEVMDRLKEIEQGGYLPVLVITAQPAHKLHALQAGARDFISKPFDFPECLARVRNMLEIRLLHLESLNYSHLLEDTVRELEHSREVIRIQTLAEQERSEQELTLARETQQSLLPRKLPQFSGFHVRAYNHPTRYVGGDFYDFLDLGKGEWAGVLADVSGKGIPAALLASMVLGALSTELRSGTPPLVALQRVNQLLCEKSLPYQFVTLFLFLLTPAGAGQFVSAGHNPTCLYRAAAGRLEDLISESFFLGMFDFASYHSQPFQLDIADILMVYSDGLTDARNRADEMFGEARLRNLILEHAPGGSLSIEQHVLSAIAEFTDGVPQTDDITFLMVERNAP